MKTWIFPVQDPATFYDSFGEARNGGRKHEGIDLFAPIGAYVYAVADGVATKGTDPLGGNVVKLVHADGAGHSYYAHLSAYGDTGTVKAGDILGRVGISGDAKGTRSHLHFGWYTPNAVNPIAFLSGAVHVNRTPRRWGLLALAGLALGALGFVAFGGKK